MATDGVEIKVTYRADQFDRAMSVLDLDDDEDLTIWFYEDLRPGSRLSLLDAGVIIRVRDRDEDSDATMKMRPCDHPEGVEAWLEVEPREPVEVTIEEDWAGDRKDLAASAQAPLTVAAFAAVEAGQPPPAGLLHAQLVSYLQACAPIEVRTGDLTALGPIQASKWRDVNNAELRDRDLRARAERWRVPGLQFLELSIKVDDPAEAEAAQLAFESALTELGLAPEQDQDSKTRRVLEALADRR